MRLFSTDSVLLEGPGGPPVIPTPLGVVTLSCTRDHDRFTDQPAVATYALPKGGRVLVWGDASTHSAELLLARLAPELPGGMSVLGCWGALWRIAPGAPTSSVTFEAAWQPGYSWTTCGPDSGENLVAQRYDDSRHTAHLATAESEYVGRRNNVAGEWPQTGEQWQDAVPPEWTSALEVASVRYTDGGLDVALPAAAASGPLESHFALAWQSRREDDLSSWFAADIAPADILAAAGCR